LILLAVLSSGAAATAQDGSPYGDRIQAFLTRPDQQKLQSLALLHAWASAAGGPCKAVNVTKEALTLPGPVTFDDRGTPLSGAWKHTLVLTGCGQSRTLNLFYVAEGSGNVKRVAGAPGSTGADLVLQRDSVPYVLAGAAPLIPRSCKQIYLIDTENLGTEADPLPGIKDSPWREYWTLRGCGASARVTMHFIPDSTGTTIRVEPKETKPVDVQ
jgi:hypothetical protein